MNCGAPTRFSWCRQISALGYGMEIRDADVQDAPFMCDLLRRSISELCILDHSNDPEILSQWLRNKTPKLIGAWMKESGHSVLVAVEQDTILAVGAVTDSGEITSNYVLPEARFRGVSRAMIRALELRAIERGNELCTLASTETARSFYQADGYVETGPPECRYGMSSAYPMSKCLTPIQNS